MYWGFVLAPFVSWLCSGLLKFLINSVRARSFAFSEIGYGGFPSTHTAIVTAPAATIAFRESVAHPAFAVAMALVMIVILDAMSLRRRIGEHASLLNLLSDRHNRLRERLGHRPHEVVGGICVGIVCGYLLANLP
ncbi:MAG: acid phosphatase [Pirellula sp.]|nr:acid phosphatase [Pirellula sp.]